MAGGPLVEAVQDRGVGPDLGVEGGALRRRRRPRSSTCRPRCGRSPRGRGPRRRPARPCRPRPRRRPGVEEAALDDLHVVADLEHPRRHPADLDVGVGAASPASAGPRSPRPRGSPAARRRRGPPAGASSTIRTSSTRTTLVISLSAPARWTIAFWGRPDEVSVAWKPRASASMATKTPTVPAIPSTATTEERPALLRAPQVVGDGDGHGQTLRSASTTLRRMAPSAGSRPARKPVPERDRHARGERRAGEEHRAGSRS